MHDLDSALCGDFSLVASLEARDCAPLGRFEWGNVSPDFVMLFWFVLASLGASVNNAIK
jgi:hypothetical protein